MGIPRVTNNALQQKVSAVVDNTWNFSRFFFSILIKSLTLKYKERDSNNRALLFSKEFIENLTKVLDLLLEKIVHLEFQERYSDAKSLNEDIAFFVKDLFSVLDRGQVFLLVTRYRELC
jgi:hypothetical protein